MLRNSDASIASNTSDGGKGVFCPCCELCFCSEHSEWILHRYLVIGEWNARPWNNGKCGAKLVFTSSTTPGLQIHTVNHIRTANSPDWLLCGRAALQLVGCPHSLVYLHLPVVEGLIFCISATPHQRTSFPLFHAQS